MKRSIVWFRNDLRIHDNEALLDAIKQNDEIIPVYVFDDRVFNGRTKYGFEKTSAFRAQFIIDSIHDLKKSFQNIGSDLIVRVGKPEEILPKIARELKTSYVYCNRERTQEEVDVQDALENILWSIGQEMRYYRGKMLYYTADLPFPITHCPDQFSSFRKEVEKYIPIREPLTFNYESINKISDSVESGEIPSVSDFNIEQRDLSKIAFKGGEKQALEELNYYIWETQLIKNYFNTRNQLLGRDFSSKLSAYLSQGCISPKLVYAEVKRFEEAHGSSKSSYWLIFELLWRDFFRFMAKKHGNKIFKYSGIKGNNGPELQEDSGLFDKWKNGLTGIPFIDANMKELNQTGFMSNRGRQNVASFLVKDLKQNWIKGAEYFESLLLDYDPCSNYGNWNYIAGVGSDPREDRYFNIASQARKYDPQAEFMKSWLPELNSAPLELIINPTKDDQNTLNQEFGYTDSCLSTNYWS